LRSFRLVRKPAKFETEPGSERPPRMRARPVTFILVGLALTVVIWGLQYKLSLYHPHPSASVQVSVAKLWLGPRKTTAVLKTGHARLRRLSCFSLPFLLPHCPRHAAGDSNDGGFVPKLVLATRNPTKQEAPRSPPSLKQMG